PPIHCRIERQSNSPGGRRSRPTITVAPVAVIPETDSKNASARSSSIDDAINGMAPATQAVSHSRFTTRKPKREEIVGARPCVAKATASERPPVKNAEKAKTCQSWLP